LHLSDSSWLRNADRGVFPRPRKKRDWATPQPQIELRRFTTTWGELSPGK
jgi:hypothetical protein